MASHQFAKFGGHRHCDSENIMILGYHVISQDHIIKGSCDFIGRNPSRYKVRYDPPKFGGHRHCGSGDIMIIFVTWSYKISWSKFHMTLKAEIKVSYDPAKFSLVTIDTVV